MKFIIGLIALIFIALVVYIFTGKNHKEVAKSAVAHKIEKMDVTKTKVEKHVEVVREVSSSVKSVAKQDKTNVKKDSNEENFASSENEIGKGLTLEGIENADLSDEESERMRDDLANYKNAQERTSTSISLEEIVQFIKKDFEQDLIN